MILGQTYLFMEGVQGDVGEEGLVGAFQLGDFELSTAAGEQYLIIDLLLGPSAHLLYERMQGGGLEGIRLVTYGLDQDRNPVIASETILRNLAITHVAQNMELEYRIAFTFDAFTTTTTTFEGVSETSGYDFVDDVALDTPLDFTTGSNASTFFQPDAWYIKIDGLHGGTTLPGLKGAFKLDAFDMAGFRDFDPESGTQGNAGYDLLKVAFLQNSSGDELLSMLLRKTDIRAVEILGVSNTFEGPRGGIVYDLRLNDVRLKSMQQDLGDQQMSLSFKKFTLTTVNSGGDATTRGFDLTTKSTLFDEIAKPAIGKEAARDADPQEWNLFLEGFAGESVVKGLEKSFSLIDFGFDWADNRNVKSLTLTFDAGNQQTKLMLDFLTANKLDFEIVGRPLGSNKVVSKFLAADALIKSYGHGEDGLVTLELTARAISRTEIGKRNVTESIALIDGKVSEKALSLEPFSKAGKFFGGELQYFLVIDGVGGEQTASGHKGWFALDEWGFDFNRLFTSDGRPAGTHFSDMSFLLSLGSARMDLIELMANGDLVNMRIVGEGVVNGQTRIVHDVRLGGASLASLDDSAKGKEFLTVDFNRISMSTLQNAANDVFITSGFNIVTEKVIKDPLPGAVPDTNASTQGAVLDHVMTIEGLDGDTFNSNYAGGFDLDDVTWDVRSDGASMEFSDITVTFEAGLAAAGLFEAAAIGEAFKMSIFSLLPTNGDEVAATNLADVYLTSMTLRSNGLDTLTFDAGLIEFETPQATFGYDDRIDQIRPPNSPVGRTDGTPNDLTAPPVNGYFLSLSGMESSENNADPDTFAIDSFEFDFSRPQQGTELQPGTITIAFKSDSAAADFQRLLASQAEVLAVEISGQGSPTNGAYEFLEFLFNDVTIAGFRQFQNRQDTLTILYDRIQLTTTGFDENGDEEQDSFAYNLREGTVDTDYFIRPTDIIS